MVCSRYSLLVFVAAGVWFLPGCAAASTGSSAEINRHQGIHVLYSSGVEEATCADENTGITVEVAADETEATFKCGDTVTALYPADCNGDVCPDTELARRGDQKVQRICEDAECGKIKALNDVFPGATRDDSTGEHVHVLKFPKEDRPQKDAWYHCKSAEGATTCKVKISVAAALKDPLEDYICSEENTDVAIEVGAEEEEARFKCSGANTELDPKDCTRGSCSSVVASRDGDGQQLQMVYDDESCVTPKPLTEIVPSATRHDDAVNHVYKLTFPKDNRAEQNLWYQCKPADRSTTCKVKISVHEAPPKPPSSTAENKCENGGEVLNLTASPSSPLTFVCPESLPLKPGEMNVYDNTDAQCKEEVELSSLVDARLVGVKQKATLVTGDTVYTLTVNKLPPKTALLCYRCAATERYLKSLRQSADDVDENDCLVKVTVGADPTATTTPVTQTETQSIPTTSSTLFLGSNMVLYRNLLIVSLLAGATHRL
ncbi:SAG-related sequence SRS26I [Toxoplasma gondii MAS]|uniref:SAG-related sequence SRS26I n=1 Tax=Toxoplasma gondii MAS TaxID=943118 RepID=A0A086PJT1_TOXGO|nr:SAG-related sequence SRS26I [Toxoplasma gondii MAS]